MEPPEELGELMRLNQWVCYKKQKRKDNGKFTKIPIDPKTGRYAHTDDPSTWGTYDQVMSRLNNVNDVDGVGFVFSSNDPYFGIDLDDVVLEDGSLSELADDIVKMMDSYTEYSMSGTGLHIICRCGRKIITGGLGRGKRSGQVEMYMAGRYFVVTGEKYGDSKPIQLRAEQGNLVYLKYLKRSEKKESPQRKRGGPPLLGKASQATGKNQRFDSNGAISVACGELSFDTERFSDDRLWKIMFGSRRGSEIRALYNGDVSRYTNSTGEPDWSRADLALANHLKFWTKSDSSRMDRMFRQSGLMRPKWDEQHGQFGTYGQMTIGRALGVR